MMKEKIIKLPLATTNHQNLQRKNIQCNSFNRTINADCLTKPVENFAIEFQPTKKLSEE